MNCMYCGANVGHEAVCPKCSADLSAQIKAIRISDVYYNRGLDKAQIRDLSGAIDLLEQSLKYNKRNLTARNLLGLIYFETGEVVSALSQWIISKNLKQTDNIATEYIEQLQADPEQLDTINQSVKRYNRALEACRSGNEDIAEIMLKKVVAVNPHLIKAYHLLALIYIKDGQWEKARKVLKRAVPIDRTNATTLRFMKEIDEQIGRESLGRDEKHSIIIPTKQKNVLARTFDRMKDRFKPSEERLLVDDEILDDVEAKINQAETVQPMAFRDTSAFSGLLYIILGIIMGALVIWFLVVPSVRQDAARTANEQLAELNTVIAKQTATMDEKDAEMASYDVSVKTANEQLSQASAQFNAMEKLVEAYNAYRSGNADMAESALKSIDTEQLSVGARTMHANLLTDVGDQLYSKYLNDGILLYNNAMYEEALPHLLRAREIKETEYDALSYLASTYRHLNMANEAIGVYMKIIEYFPGTQRAESADYYMNRVDNGIMEDSFASTAAEEAAILEAQRAAEQAAAEAAAAAAAAAEAAAQQAAQQAANGQTATPTPEEAAAAAAAAEAAAAAGGQ